MTNPVYRVGIVADPDFGSRLSELASRMHVWIVDTPANRAAANRIWAARPSAPSLERGVTIFQSNLDDAPDQRVVAILSTVDLHHGEYSHDPPVNVLEIHGAPLTNSLRSALGDLGFASTASGDVVLASIPPAGGTTHIARATP